MKNKRCCTQGMTALQLAVAGRHAGAMEALIRRTPGFKADAECRQVGALLLTVHCSLQSIVYCGGHAVYPANVVCDDMFPA